MQSPLEQSARWTIPEIRRAQSNRVCTVFQVPPDSHGIENFVFAHMSPIQDDRREPISNEQTKDLCIS